MSLRAREPRGPRGSPGQCMRICVYVHYYSRTGRQSDGAKMWHGDGSPPAEGDDMSLGALNPRGPREPPGTRTQNRSQAVRPTGLRFGTETSCHQGGKVVIFCLGDREPRNPRVDYNESAVTLIVQKRAR
jgi:hypothetical protein